jgi:hypothetical protein
MQAFHHTDARLISIHSSHWPLSHFTNFVDDTESNTFTCTPGSLSFACLSLSQEQQRARDAADRHEVALQQARARFLRCDLRLRESSFNQHQPPQPMTTLFDNHHSNLATKNMSNISRRAREIFFTAVSRNFRALSVSQPPYLFPPLILSTCHFGPSPHHEHLSFLISELDAERAKLGAEARRAADAYEDGLARARREAEERALAVKQVRVWVYRVCLCICVWVGVYEYVRMLTEVSVS